LVGLKKKSEHVRETSGRDKAENCPIVLVGPYEHHSNLLPWRETHCNIISISEDASQGGVDCDHLHRVLESIRKEEAAKKFTRRLVIGSFSAASNVSGILTDTRKVTEILHKYGAFSFWDYATAGPYVGVDMHPGGAQGGQGGGGGAAKDAIVMSTHKFLGGPGSPGILVVKRALLARRLVDAPTEVGGGTVFFVGDTWHRYLENLEEREEGGTPDIIGAVRAGLVFQLKEAIGVRNIEAIERGYLDLVMPRLQEHPYIRLLGNTSATDRLPIFSFNISAPSPFSAQAGRQQQPNPPGGSLRDLILHYGFVSALLNDLFGVQARGGCACAGPYAQQCLGINSKRARALETELLKKGEILRPGFVRVCFHYAMTKEDVDNIVRAITFVATHGWKLLPLYHFKMESGEWVHRRLLARGRPNRRWIARISYKNGSMCYPPKGGLGDQASFLGFKESVEDATRVVASLQECPPVLLDQTNVLPRSILRLRWFMLPSEAASLLQNPNQTLETLRPDLLDMSKLDLTSDIKSAPSLMEPEGNGAEARASIGAEARVSIDMGLCRNCFHPHSMGKDRGLECRSCDCIDFAPLSGVGVPSMPYKGVGEKALSVGQLGVSHESGHHKEGSDDKEASDKDIDGNKCDDSASSHTRSNLPQKRKENPVVPMMEEQPADQAEGTWAGGEHKANLQMGKKRKSSFNSSESKTRHLRQSEANVAVSKKQREKRRKKLLKNIGREVGKAIQEFDMIREGDRILIGVSGGKDSLTLLNVLLEKKRKAPINFEVAACTVDPQAPEYDPSPLKAYMKSKGVAYFYESQNILETAKELLDPTRDSICSFCSRMRRGVLYNAARKHNYNVLALGQHLDDLAESFVMSAFHNGSLRTMKAHYSNDKGDVRIIRPLV